MQAKYEKKLWEINQLIILIALTLRYTKRDIETESERKRSKKKLCNILYYNNSVVDLRRIVVIKQDIFPLHSYANFSRALKKVIFLHSLLPRLITDELTAIHYCVPYFAKIRKKVNKKFVNFLLKYAISKKLFLVNIDSLARSVSS